jgi:hypothetical protein
MAVDGDYEYVHRSIVFKHIHIIIGRARSDEVLRTIRLIDAQEELRRSMQLPPNAETAPTGRWY